MSTITAPAPISRLHPANLSDFDGDRSKGRTFLNSCKLVYALRPLDFANDHTHVLWTLSFMKTGRANSFVEQTLRWEVGRGPRYASYTAFRTMFIEKFCPMNEAWSTIMHLESQEYHQGSWDVDSYIDKFEDLIEISGYTNLILIVLKFR